MSERYPEGITEADHTAHDMRMGRFPNQSSIADFLNERAAEDKATLLRVMSSKPTFEAVAQAAQTETVVALRKRLDNQIAYAIDLQRIIEALCSGSEIREPETGARHHYNMAIAYQAAMKGAPDEIRRLAEINRKLHRQMEAGEEAARQAIQEVLLREPEVPEDVVEALRLAEEALSNEADTRGDSDSGYCSPVAPALGAVRAILARRVQKLGGR